MRKHNFIIGSITAIIAFGTLYLLLQQKAPELIRWYCEGQIKAGNDLDVDACVEAHKNAGTLGLSKGSD